MPLHASLFRPSEDALRTIVSKKYGKGRESPNAGSSRNRIDHPLASSLEGTEEETRFFISSSILRTDVDQKTNIHGFFNTPHPSPAGVKRVEHLHPRIQKITRVPCDDTQTMDPCRRSQQSIHSCPKARPSCDILHQCPKLRFSARRAQRAFGLRMPSGSAFRRPKHFVQGGRKSTKAPRRSTRGNSPGDTPDPGPEACPHEQWRGRQLKNPAP